MRFRAERDALVDAMATAGRAAATRGGALPALSGIRLELTDDRLHLAGSDLDLSVQVEIGVSGQEPGVCVVPARLATEGALWGAIQAHGLLPGTVIVSDDAGQFNVGEHALCRVGGDVAIPTPHRPGRADFPHPVLHERDSLAAA